MKNFFKYIFFLFSKSGELLISNLKTVEQSLPDELRDGVTNFRWTGNGTGTSSDPPNLMVVTGTKIHVLIIGSSEDKKVSEIFCHDGHRAEILESVFHPGFRNLFFSSDSKNSLHAWSFKN